MAVAEHKAAYAPPGRRHPRLVRLSSWLRRHSAAVAVVAGVGLLAIFVLDVSVRPIPMSGFYLIPLTLLAVTGRYRWVAWAGAACFVSSVAVMWNQGTLHWPNLFNLLYGVLAGVGLIVLSYLIGRLGTISEYASLRAQLAEAGADIFGSGQSRDDLDELLQYALERLGEQLDATGGLLLLLEDGRWAGRAGFGLGVDAREIAADVAGIPLAAEAVGGDRAVVRDLGGRAERAGALAEHLRLERVLLVPLSALESTVGLMVYNRPSVSGEYRGEQVELAESVASYLAVAVENVRLMVENTERRHDLELVRDSSLDFAQSLDMQEVLEAVVSRLLDALHMDACDLYEVDLEAATLRLVVSYGDYSDESSWAPTRDFPLQEFASSALAVTSRLAVVVTSPDDPRLNERERALFLQYGHHTQLSIPLRVRERVIALVELYDNHQEREISEEEVELARTICRFAALAIEKARLFDQERAITERRDRLARRLQRLQAFSVDLNRRLEGAEPEDVMDEVAHAALDLLHVRVAAVISGSGEYLGLRSLQVAGSDAGTVWVDDRAVIEESLLERCRELLAVPGDETLAGGRPLSRGVLQADGLLLATLEAETPQQSSALVVTDRSQGAFDDEDVLLIATLAAQLGASLHNVTAYQREHAVAATFQRALLMEPPGMPGVDVGVRYRAATEAVRVGGDFYDLVPLGPGRLVVIVGDVCGKSLAAAAQSAVVRYMLRAYAAEGSPGEALSRLNSAMIMQSPNQPFVTLVIAYVDVTRHMFEFAVAGHPRPIILAGHDDFPAPGEGNVPAGIFRGAVYPTNRVVLPEDSLIVLYTDGMTDARRDGVLFGEQRLHESVRENLELPAQELADHLLATVSEYAGDVLTDDCAVVAIKLP